MKHETVLTIEDEIKITEAWCNGNRTASDLISETERFILTKQAEKAQPVDMVLYCPKCGMQHIDAPDERTPDWATRRTSPICATAAATSGGLATRRRMGWRARRRARTRTLPRSPPPRCWRRRRRR